MEYDKPVTDCIFSSYNMTYLILKLSLSILTSHFIAGLTSYKTFLDA